VEVVNLEEGRTGYVRSGDGYLAVHARGAGPNDVVWVGNWVTNVEEMWDSPFQGPCLNALARFTRVVAFDQRGTGLSDPVAIAELGPLERWTEEVTAVLDAVAIEQAAIVAQGGAGMLAVLFAASHPERVRGLVLIGAAARYIQGDGYPWGLQAERVEAFLRRQEELWGTGTNLRWADPAAAGDERLRVAYAAEERHACGPATWAAALRMVLASDVRAVLPTVQAPTLVLNYHADPWTAPDHSRYLADHIAGATHLELSGRRHLPGLDMAAEIEAFIAGSRHEADPDRVLATVLFTDIVGSTERAAKLGDRKWRELLDAHDRTVRRQLERFRGREVKSSGDGFLATFDGPGRAIDCASAIRDAVRALGVEVRAGLHTGEIEVRGDDVAGIAVHIGARVAALAGGGEVLVSAAVPPLVAGSGITFTDRGDHTLKGVPYPWRLFEVTS